MEQAEGVTIGVEQKRARPRPAAPPKTAVALPINGRDAARAVLDMIDLAVMIKFGPMGKFTREERAAIEGPAGRIMERLSPEAAAKLGAVSDPLMLATALGFWALRLMTLSNRPRMPMPQRSAVPVPPPPAPPAAPGPGNLPSSPHEVDPNGVTEVPDAIRKGWDESV